MKFKQFLQAESTANYKSNIKKCIGPVEDLLYHMSHDKEVDKTTLGYVKRALDALERAMDNE